jgi:hypothetical protein
MIILVEQLEAGYRKVFGAMLNLPTCKSRASEIGGGVQAITYTKVEVGRDCQGFYFGVT